MKFKNKKKLKKRKKKKKEEKLKKRISLKNHHLKRLIKMKNLHHTLKIILLKEKVATNIHMSKRIMENIAVKTIGMVMTNIIEMKEELMLF